MTTAKWRLLCEEPREIKHYGITVIHKMLNFNVKFHTTATGFTSVRWQGPRYITRQSRLLIRPKFR